MAEYKVALGYAAALIAFISYIPYFFYILKGQTKPHAFSWLVWGMLGGIAFAAQVAEGGGAGSWVTGLTALVCFTISALAFFKGTKKFAPLDWFSLFAAFVALFLWRATHGPTLSVILVTITDAVGFLPTYRKGFYKPYEETATMFALSALKWMIGIFALETYALATWLYPASLIATNGAFVMLLLVRRKQLAPQN